jgi:hypothetical protein
MDLFTPLLPQAQLCDAFKAIASNATSADRELFAHWCEGFRDRDGKFVQEFQSTFHSSFWELYLHASFKELRFEVDYSYARPDFVVATPSAFCIEAVSAQPVGGQPLGLPSPEAQAEALKDLNRLNRHAVVRLANSFASKWRKYLERYRSLPQVQGRPFVLAMAAFDSPAFFALSTRPIEALLYNYYVDEEAFISGRTGPLQGDFLEQVAKDNGAPIKLGAFSSEDFAEISAVVYNPCATWGKVRTLSAPMDTEKVVVTSLRYNPSGHLPHQVKTFKETSAERLLDGMFVFHNPFARRPLAPEVFRNPAVAQAYFDHNAGEFVHERSEGHLLFRSVQTLRVKK